MKDSLSDLLIPNTIKANNKPIVDDINVKSNLTILSSTNIFMGITAISIVATTQQIGITESPKYDLIHNLHFLCA